MGRTNRIVSKHTFHNVKKKIPKKAKHQGRVFHHVTKKASGSLDPSIKFTITTVTLLAMVGIANAHQCHQFSSVYCNHNPTSSTLMTMQKEMTTAYALNRCHELPEIPAKNKEKEKKNKTCQKRESTFEKMLREGVNYFTCAVSKVDVNKYGPLYYPRNVYPLRKDTKYDETFVREIAMSRAGCGLSDPIVIGLPNGHEKELLLHKVSMCKQYFPRAILGIPQNDDGDELLGQIWERYMIRLQECKSVYITWWERHTVEFSVFVDVLCEFKDHPLVEDLLCIRGDPFYHKDVDINSILCPGNFMEYS